MPIGVAAIEAGWRLLPDERGMGLAAGADAAGAVLVTAGLMIGVYAIVETTRYGWGSTRTLGTAAAAAALLAAFFVRQHVGRTPLLPFGAAPDRLAHDHPGWGASAGQPRWREIPCHAPGEHPLRRPR